jgi:hypothetical protein
LTPRLRPRRDPRLRLLGSVASLRRPRRSAVPVEQKDGRFPETNGVLAVASGGDHACCAPDVEGLVKAVDGPGRGREPTASSNPCRLTSWTGGCLRSLRLRARGETATSDSLRSSQSRGRSGRPGRFAADASRRWAWIAPSCSREFAAEGRAGQAARAMDGRAAVNPRQDAAPTPGCTGHGWPCSREFSPR